jgi:hypothetical protein
MTLPFPNRMRRHLSHVAALAAGLLLLGAGISAAQMSGQGGGHGMRGQGLHGHGMHGHGADGTGHDEVTMPGLRGLNATPEESAELALMFRNFDTLTREVENLPDGIRTVTRSSDPVVMDALVSHVVGMIGRVETGNDPMIMIQSPTLEIFFARGASIRSEIDVTEDGIVVVQRSDEPDVVEALHLHAAEVTAMADRGMQAVHEMMMQRAGN